MVNFGENNEDFKEMLEEYMPEIEIGQIKKGEITSKDSEYGYLDIGGKSDGRLRVSEVADYEVGDQIDVLVLNKEDKEGYVRISRLAVEQAQNWEKIKEAFEKELVLEGIVDKRVKGGYIVEVLKYMSFMPNSLSGLKNDEEVSGKKIKVIIKDIKEGKKKKILVSGKEVKMKHFEEAIKKVGGSVSKGDMDRYRKIIDLHSVELKKAEKILDTGTGTGNLTLELLMSGHNVTAIDTNELMLKFLIRKCSKYKDKLEVRNMDVQDLGFGDGEFDGVSSMFVIPFVKDNRRYFSEVYRVLREGGKFSISAWAPEKDSFSGILGFQEKELRVKGILPRCQKEWNYILESARVGLDMVLKGPNIKELGSMLKETGFRNIKILPENSYGKYVYFLTPNTTRKYENLTENPKVSILVNNSRNRADDIYNAISVTGTGISEVVDKSKGRKAMVERILDH